MVLTNASFASVGGRLRTTTLVRSVADLVDMCLPCEEQRAWLLFVVSSSSNVILCATESAPACWPAVISFRMPYALSTIHHVLETVQGTLPTISGVLAETPERFRQWC